MYHLFRELVLTLNILYFLFVNIFLIYPKWGSFHNNQEGWEFKMIEVIHKKKVSY